MLNTKPENISMLIENILPKWRLYWNFYKFNYKPFSLKIPLDAVSLHPKQQRPVFNDIRKKFIGRESFRIGPNANNIIIDLTFSLSAHFSFILGCSPLSLLLAIGVTGFSFLLLNAEKIFAPTSRKSLWFPVAPSSLALQSATQSLARAASYSEQPGWPRWWGAWDVSHKTHHKPQWPQCYQTSSQHLPECVPPVVSPLHPDFSLGSSERNKIPVIFASHLGSKFWKDTVSDVKILWTQEISY